MACRCPVPQIHANPRYRSCANCLRVIDPAIVSDTPKLQTFLSSLHGIPTAMVAQCHQREQDGRQEFGLQYLGRDNVVAFREEAADGANYMFFETLRDRRAGRDEDPALFLAAHHMAEAYRLLAGRR